MMHTPVRTKLMTPSLVMLAVLMLAGLVAVVVRCWLGLGAVTNLSDTYPWGLWKIANVLCAVALAAGSFTVAGLVYIFGGEKYHGFARPAVLMGLLGYSFVGIGLMVDIGHPWRIWHPTIMWAEHSLLFEIAWCVMLYISVQALELAPAVFERFNWTWLDTLWRKLVPAYVVVALTFFVYIMSHSMLWAALLFVMFAALALAIPRVFQSSSGLPIILIIGGITFSTMHQSSLGALFLLMPEKLSHLWWTPIIGVNFLLSAIAAGFAVVIIQAMVSAKAFGRSVNRETLVGLGRILCYALAACFVVRMADVVVRGQLGAAFADGNGALFLIDVLGGLALPALMLSSAKLRESPTALITATLLVVGGVILNRFNVAILGMTMPGEGSYFPSFTEWLITLSIAAAIVFLFTVGSKILPIFPNEESETPAMQGTSVAAGGD